MPSQACIDHSSLHHVAKSTMPLGIYRILLKQDALPASGVRMRHAMVGVTTGPRRRGRAKIRIIRNISQKLLCLKLWPQPMV